MRLVDQLQNTRQASRLVECIRFEIASAAEASRADMVKLRSIYEAYIACLNDRRLDALDRFVSPDVIHNARCLHLAGYRAMLEGDFEAIPDLTFAIEHLVCEPPMIAARLTFDCHPRGRFLGLLVDGRGVRFAENVLYRIEGLKIIEVWSVIDKVAIEAQLGGPQGYGLRGSLNVR